MLEFALVGPLLLVLVLGSIEFGRAMMIGELAIAAARTGCRQGVLANQSTSDIENAVTNFLKGSRVSGQSTKVLVNGGSTDASAAVPGDRIHVTVSIPLNENSWLPGPLFLGGSRVEGAVVMRRE